MTRRGRPPHPDILTPRQWEVLDHLRRGYSDQQIADALDLTLAGAKYHVSEILTKLGVSSREGAAAWQPNEPRAPWWRRALALSLAVKVAGAAIVVAAAAGLAVLAWGVANSRAGDDAPTKPNAVFEDLVLPPPNTPPQLTREQALIEASRWVGGDIRAADVQVSTMDAINIVDGGGAVEANSATGWYVRVRGYNFDFRSSGSGGPLSYGQDQTTTVIPQPPCIETMFHVEDFSPATGASGGIGFGGGDPIPQSECEVAFTSDAAIMAASKALFSDVLYRTPAEVTATQMTLPGAVAALDSVGIETAVQPGADDQDDQVWLVTMRDRFVHPGSPTPVPETPHPTPVHICLIVMAIVEPGSIIEAGSAPSNDC